MLSNGKYGTISSVEVEELETPETTYNFEVADFHTYYVGTKGILVHNCCEAVGEIQYADLPDEAKYAFDQYSKNNWKGNFKGQTPGTRAGAVYKNSNGLLPTDVTYREFDIVNKVAGHARNAQRFVVGSNMKIYYTYTHCGDLGNPAFLLVMK